MSSNMGFIFCPLKCYANKFMESLKKCFITGNKELSLSLVFITKISVILICVSILIIWSMIPAFSGVKFWAELTDRVDFETENLLLEENMAERMGLSL